MSHSHNQNHDELYEHFVKRIGELKIAQQNIHQSLPKQAKALAQHGAEAVKQFGSDARKAVKQGAAKKEAVTQSAETHLRPFKREAAARAKRALGIKSNLHLEGLAQAMQQFNDDYKVGNFNAAINELNRIEKEYKIVEGAFYDSKLREYFNEIRKQTVANLSDLAVRGTVNDESTALLKSWRKRDYEGERAGLIGILKRARNGGEDSRKAWEKILDKIDLSVSHTKERIKKMRRHINYDSRNAVDYLIAEISLIDFSEENNPNNHYLKIAKLIADEGKKIASSTVNRSVLDGLSTLADQLLELTKGKYEAENIKQQMEILKVHVQTQVKQIEENHSYSLHVRKIVDGLQDKNFKQGQEKVNQSMSAIFRLAQEKDYVKKNLVTPYVPPQMEMKDRKAVCAKVMEGKLKEMFSLAYRADIGLAVPGVRGDAAAFVGDKAKGVASGAVNTVAGKVSGGVGSVVKSVLPSAFGIDEALGGLASDLSETGLKALGDKYLTDPFVNKVESILDQKQSDAKKAILMKFILTLSASERADIAKAFAENLAMTFPVAFEKLMINQHDDTTMGKIAAKLMETALYRLSHYAEQLIGLKKDGNALDADVVAQYMVKSLIEANEQRVLVKGIKQSWRVHVVTENPENPGTKIPGGHPHVEDLLGGRCGIVTVDEDGTLNYYAPENTNPHKHGYRFCRKEDLPLGFEAYKYDQVMKKWGTGAAEVMQLEEHNEKLDIASLNAIYDQYKAPYQKLAKDAKPNPMDKAKNIDKPKVMLAKTRDPMQRSYHALQERIKTLEVAQKNIYKSLPKQARDFAQHVAEEVKKFIAEAKEHMKKQHGQRQAITKSAKKIFNPLKREAAAHIKKVLGIESNMHLHSLLRAMQEFESDYRNNRFDAAIYKLDRIEKEYRLSEGRLYDSKVRNHFDAIRNEVTMSLSNDSSLTDDSKVLLKAWRKRDFELEQKKLIGVLNSARSGGEDGRKFWERWIDKLDLSKEHTHDRIKRMRRHVNYDSRNAMDYLAAEMARINFNEDDDQNNHYIKLAELIVKEGKLIASSTVNRSILDGLKKFADQLMQLAKSKNKGDAIEDHLNELKTHIDDHIKKIENEHSYGPLVREVAAGLQARSRETVDKAMNAIVDRAKGRAAAKKGLVTPYVPPQMEADDRKAICAKILESKLKEMYSLAFRADIGIVAGDKKGDAASFVGGKAQSSTKGATEAVADKVSNKVGGVVKSALPTLFGIDKAVGGLATDLSNAGLKALGDKYLTDPLVKKAESILDQKQSDAKKAVLMTFLLTLSVDERVDIAKAFANQVAVTFPIAFENLMINKHDQETMSKIAAKLMETALYRLSQYAEELVKLKKGGTTLDANAVANFMMRSLVEANEQRVLVKGIKQSWRVQIAVDDPERVGKKMPGGHPHVEDMFGGRSGIVTVGLNGELNYYAPENTNPTKHGYRFCREVDLPVGFEAYKFNRNPPPGQWGAGVNDDVRLEESNPAEHDKKYQKYQQAFSEFASKQATKSRMTTNISTHADLHQKMMTATIKDTISVICDKLYDRIEKLEISQKNTHKSLFYQAQEFTQHVAKEVKAFGREAFAIMEQKSGKRAALQESAEKHYRPLKREAAARSKKALGIESNMHLHSLSDAMKQFEIDYMNKHFDKAIDELNQIEQEYKVAGGRLYDSKVRHFFREIRNEVVKKFSHNALITITPESKAILKAWRKRDFEMEQSELISILQSARAGGEDSRQFWEKWLDKADLSVAHTKERIKKLRRHINYDSRNSIDYLMAEMALIGFSEETSAAEITKNHYLRLATLLAHEGKRIANGTVNRSIIDGLMKAADKLIEMTKNQDTAELVRNQMESLKDNLNARIKLIESEYSYSPLVKQVAEALKDKDFDQAMKNVNASMNAIFRRAQEKDVSKESIVIPYVPPQMSIDSKKAVCANVLEGKLKELHSLAFRADIGLTVSGVKGDAASFVGGKAKSGAESLVGAVAGAVSEKVGSVVQSILPNAFGIDEALGGIATDLSDAGLKALGDKYLTDPLVEKIESVLDQQQNEAKRGMLMQFLLTLSVEERADIAKAFADQLATTFPMALENLMINKHDEATMSTIAGKLMETSLYQLSQFADELIALKKDGAALDANAVANYMIQSLIEANEQRVLVKGIKQSWRVHVTADDPNNKGEKIPSAHHPHLEDIFGGRCGIVTVDANGTLNYYAPENTRPDKHGYRFCRAEDLPMGYDAYKYDHKTQEWGSGVLEDVCRWEPDPTVNNARYEKHQVPFEHRAQHMLRNL